MELSVNTIFSTEFTHKHLHIFQPGDRVTLKVLKRIEAFRYLVKMSGQTFEVNSSVLLNPNDLILIELRKTKPRLIFNFIENVSGSLSQINTSQLNQTLRLGKHPLASLFLQWSIKLGLPIRKSEFKRIKRFFDINKMTAESVNSFLLNYFWGKLNFSADFFKDPFFLMRFFYEKNFIDKQKASFKEKKDNIFLEETHIKKIVTILNRLLKEYSFVDVVELLMDPDERLDLFTQRSPLAEKNITLFNKTQKDWLDTIEPDSPPVFMDLIKLLYIQHKRFEENQWIACPLSIGNSEKRCFSFIRKFSSDEKLENEFLFVFSSNNFGDICVNGKIKDRELFLKIYNAHQGLKGIVDKYRDLLQKKLKYANFNLKKMDFVRSRDIYNSIGKLLLSNHESKIEVII